VERTICPFSFHNAENENYLLAHCEKRRDIREFNIKRIISIELLNEHFPSSMRSAITNHFENSIGAFGGTSFKVKLHVKPPFARVMQEKIYVKNQKVHEQSDGSVLFEARISGRPDVVRWVLGMGASCEVLEPKDLREEVQGVLREALGQY
jgi:predicted DNA-binding transcriptional regulator YafY